MQLLDLNGGLIHEDDSIKTDVELVESAIAAKKILDGANLVGAFLDGVSLNGASLIGANFDGASLVGASLMCANLSQASFISANLDYASLKEANCDSATFKGASHIDANMIGVSFIGANIDRTKLNEDGMIGMGFQFRAPVITDIHQALFDLISVDGNKLDMSSWHTDYMIHDHAGWVCILAGDDGWELESCVGTRVAAEMIYRASDATMTDMPDWYASNDDAMAFIQQMASPDVLIDSNRGTDTKQTVDTEIPDAPSVSYVVKPNFGDV